MTRVTIFLDGSPAHEVEGAHRDQVVAMASRFLPDDVRDHVLRLVPEHAGWVLKTWTTTIDASNGGSYTFTVVEE